MSTTGRRCELLSWWFRQTRRKPLARRVRTPDSFRVRPTDIRHVSCFGLEQMTDGLAKKNNHNHHREVMAPRRFLCHPIFAICSSPALSYTATAVGGTEKFLSLKFFSPDSVCSSLVFLLAAHSDRAGGGTQKLSYPLPDVPHLSFSCDESQKV